MKQQLGIWDGQEAHSNFGATLNTLTRAVEELGRVDGRRTLVYFGDSVSESRMTYIEDLARQANLSDVAIYVVASDSLVIPSIAERGAPRQSSLPPGGEYGALGVLAESTGGKIFRRAVTGAIVMPQIARALSAHYVLTFNVESPDKDGKTHKIDVKVNRKDVDVRFRKEFAR
jgi:VWFA-related protein